MVNGCTSTKVDANWLIPTAAFFLHFTSLGMQYSIGLYFLPIQHEFNANRATTAWMGSLCVGLMLGFGFFGGFLMDMYDPRVLLVLASLTLSLGLLLGSYSTTLPVLFFCIALSGAACSIHIQAAGTIQPWFDKKKGLATGIAMAGSGLGNFVFALGIGAFLAAPSTIGNWREALRWESFFLLVFSIPASVLLKKRNVVSVVAPPPPPSTATAPATPSTTPSTTPVTSLILERRMLALLISKAIGAFGYGIPFVHLVPLMSDKGRSEPNQALALGIIGLASLVGRVVLGAVGDRMGHTRLFQIGMFQLAIAMFVLPHCESMVSFCLIAIHYGFWAGGFVSLPPSIISIWFSDYPTKVGRLVGINFCADTVGAIAGPVIVGAMYDVFGNYIVSFSIQAGLLVVATACSCYMPTADKRPKEVVLHVPDVHVDVEAASEYVPCPTVSDLIL